MMSVLKRAMALHLLHRGQHPEEHGQMALQHAVTQVLEKQNEPTCSERLTFSRFLQ